MSLILEALRKSEAERQRAQVPGLHAPVPAPIIRRVAPVWGPWVAGLLGVVLLVGTWWVGQAEDSRGRAERPETSNPPDAAAPPGLSALPREPAPEPEVVTTPEPEPPVETVKPPPPAPVAAPPPEIRTPTPAPPPQAVPIAPIEAPPLPTAPPAQDALPGLSILSATERAALPALKVSMHVWHADAARRFAIVDGNRVGEGSVLGGGIIAAIRPDGVVLELNDGRRVLLARP